ncbi:MAG: 16S rRNA (cytosine(967)-C(5))-methyltransferase RsmB, partial [Cellulomonadaceae bacterium]|nr:16S rRNA (cytosine(967)-C(5))-methyltransferase RsmB [Cellulomonadaceae bacterium]
MPKGLDSVPPDIRDILRLSLYQLLFLEHVPHHAILDQAVRLTRWAGFDGLTGLVN